MISTSIDSRRAVKVPECTGARAVRSEPLEEGGLVTKAGFDATARPTDRVEGIERALPPRAAADAAVRWLIDNLPPEQRRWLKF